jgi:hypothetical protein
MFLNKFTYNEKNDKLSCFYCSVGIILGFLDSAFGQEK